MNITSTGFNAIGLTGSNSLLLAATATPLALETEDTNPILFLTNSAERAQITSAGDFIKTVNTSAPTLTVNNTMTTSLPNNTTLRFHVRGSDGVTRTADLTLA